jgi:hypothetical protein
MATIGNSLSAPDPLMRISYHAVMRFVQRVLDTRVPETGDALTDAGLHAQAVSLSIPVIRKLILTPEVHEAMDAGEAVAETGDFTARISPENVVVTVLASDQDDRFLQKVSFNAVTRFVRLMLGVEVTETGIPPVDAALHAQAAGMTMHDVRTLILTPQVRSAMSIGVPFANTPFFIARFSTTGVLVTILPPDSKPKRQRRTKILSRRECQRLKQAGHRKRTKSRKYTRQNGSA